MWHKMREHIEMEVKPRNTVELIKDIEEFWRTVGHANCTKYNVHIRIVIPKGQLGTDYCIYFFVVWRQFFFFSPD